MQTTLDDERLFPVDSSEPFPSNIRDTIRTMFKRLFRVYAHMRASATTTTLCPCVCMCMHTCACAANSVDYRAANRLAGMSSTSLRCSGWALSRT